MSFPVAGPVYMIQWCHFCNEAPAEGKLEVLYNGEEQTQEFWSCKKCAKEANWIGETMIR